MRIALLGSMLLCLCSSILILLILVAGTGKSVLADWFFLKTNTSSLSVPSRLSTSTFLKDLSSLTGTDLVGSDISASSLGLADIYTVTLWSSCARNEPESSTNTKCSASKFGYHFDPLMDLKLANTGLEESFSEKFHGNISYGGASRSIALAYIFALLFTVLTLSLNFLSCCAPRVIFASALSSLIATLFLLLGTSTAMAVFIRLRGQFNSELASAGIKTALGQKLFIVSWIAFGFLFLNTIILYIYNRREKQQRQRKSMPRVNGVTATGIDKNGAETQNFAPPKRTRTLQLLKNGVSGVAKGWGRHKYAQIDKQATVKGGPGDQNRDRDVLMSKGFGGGEDEDDEGQELVKGPTRGIQMQLFSANGNSRDSDTAYEAFRKTPA